MGDRAAAEGNGWRLRLRAGGKVLGAGILIAPDRALTSAHALDGTDGELTVDYADYRGAVAPSRARPLPGSVRPCGTEPADGDVALLSLDPPRAGARPAPLRRIPRYTGAKVLIGGFPARGDEGLWVRARVEGPYGAWWQLTPENQVMVLEAGFSGAGVANAQLDQVSPEPPPEVLGMVVSRFYDDGQVPQFEKRHGHMIPLDRIAELLPEVDRLIGGPAPRDAALSAVVPARPGTGADAGLAARLAGWAAGAGPPVLLATAPEGSARDLAFTAGLDRVEIALDAAGSRADDLAYALGERLRLPEPYGSAFTAWLRGGGPRPALRDSGRQLDLPVRVAVAGADTAAEPIAALGVLTQLAALGVRLLVVLRRPGTEFLKEAERRVECPALRGYARGLVRRVIALERGRTGPRMANARNAALTAHDCARDPVAVLRELADRLRADIARLEGPR
ncbi:S1 family peptidase [Streptomyces sp. CMB-StM0423]|uniref:S1 family peptidase n=1 Tax=Streptomyces sp. CMB-StM0423 TaxID=2059884 RepID=UPI000C714E2B|nr:serine protease [Streptomyces sp. CMB-StM0423]AUH42961.1 serine protease [Streptomyces sp. CMB-StM0423]